MSQKLGANKPCCRACARAKQRCGILITPHPPMPADAIGDGLTRDGKPGTVAEPCKDCEPGGACQRL